MKFKYIERGLPTQDGMSLGFHSPVLSHLKRADPCKTNPVLHANLADSPDRKIVCCVDILPSVRGVSEGHVTAKLQ